MSEKKVEMMNECSLELPGLGLGDKTDKETKQCVRVAGNKTSRLRGDYVG